MRLIALTLILILIGCGTPGAPQPPSLNIPKQVNDLKAIRKGDTVTLSWTAPKQTTDGALVRHTGKMVVHRNTGESQSTYSVGVVPLEAAQKSQQPPAESLKDSLTDLLRSASADFAFYSVESLNGSSKSAGPSNQVAVPLVLTPPAPKDLEAKLVPQGVRLSWSQVWPSQGRLSLNPQYVYRVMRRQAGSDLQPILVKQLSAGNEQAVLIDNSIEWEKQYQYWVTPVTLWQTDRQQKGEAEGDDSNVATISAHDVFPPAVPSGLQAVFSQVGNKSFIDLTWIPDMDQDLAGYNVYRRTEDSQPVKLNSTLIKTPAFRDENVQPGAKYFYSVSAVDLRDNESAKSAEASESVPQ